MSTQNENSTSGQYVVKVAGEYLVSTTSYLESPRTRDIEKATRYTKEEAEKLVNIYGGKIIPV